MLQDILFMLTFFGNVLKEEEKGGHIMKLDRPRDPDASSYWCSIHISIYISIYIYS